METAKWFTWSCGRQRSGERVGRGGAAATTDNHMSVKVKWSRASLVSYTTVLYCFDRLLYSSKYIAEIVFENFCASDENIVSQLGFRSRLR